MPRRWIAGLCVAGVVIARPALADPDYEKCKDVLVPRLPGFHIQECFEEKRDAYTFAQGTPKETRVEGHVVDTYYRHDAGTDAPSSRAVRANYENVFKQAGWTVVYADSDTLAQMQVKDGQERWVQLMSNAGDFYELVTVQKGEPDEKAPAAAGMLSALNENGHVPVQIDFDPGKATVRPSSLPTVVQIAALLQDNPLLRLTIEGHTDNAGEAKANKRLSEARAKAVVAVLVAMGIGPTRLKAAGFGQERPVADNATPEGRAKNRRLELVKQ